MKIIRAINEDNIITKEMHLKGIDEGNIVISPCYIKKIWFIDNTPCFM